MWVLFDDVAVGRLAEAWNGRSTGLSEAEEVAVASRATDRVAGGWALFADVALGRRAEALDGRGIVSSVSEIDARNQKEGFCGAGWSKFVALVWVLFDDVEVGRDARITGLSEPELCLYQFLFRDAVSGSEELELGPASTGASGTGAKCLNTP